MHGLRRIVEFGFLLKPPAVVRQLSIVFGADQDIASH